MKKYLPIILFFLILASCGSKKGVFITDLGDTIPKTSFNKALKSNNYELKYLMATDYYERGKFMKAIDLFEQLVPHYRGLTRGEEVYYLYCMSNMNIGDYLYAGYHFKNFYDLYPHSSYAEESLFLSAYCNYLETPRWSLDQQPTVDAIDQFQLFVSTYPQSNLIDSTNFLVDTMRFTLEKKAYMTGKLYYDLGYFNSAEIALNNTIRKFPDSPYNEDALYHIVKANHKYANGSIKKMQTKRYKNTISNCLRYLNKYPDGIYVQEVEKIRDNSQKKINTITQ